jgi:Putative peptidoglycan binding domain
MLRERDEQEQKQTEPATQATTVRKRRRLRSRTLALASAAAAVAAVAGVAATGLVGSDMSAGAAPAATATATVARRHLVQRSTVSGTLGYGDARKVVTYRRGTITSVPGEGSFLSANAVLYRVDESPVVLLAGSKPAWRQLAVGKTEGGDVRQLEQNLRALGYDEEGELAIDERFDDSTPAAVERWQADVGLEVTGRVSSATSCSCLRRAEWERSPCRSATAPGRACP